MGTLPQGYLNRTWKRPSRIENLDLWMCWPTKNKKVLYFSAKNNIQIFRDCRSTFDASFQILVRATFSKPKFAISYSASLAVPISSRLHECQIYFYFIPEIWNFLGLTKGKKHSSPGLLRLRSCPQTFLNQMCLFN